MVLPKPVVSEADRTDMLLRKSRYQLLAKIASGGMASVYLGRLRGAVGFWRLVAVKRAHAHLVDVPGFKRSLIAEASLASKIHHPHVVPVLDVEEFEDELLLVMEYVEGATLSRLVEQQEPPLPPAMVIRIILDACAGLHAAHTLTDETGKPLNLIHRDVSPQNIIVGVDGLSRLTDFGIAKCSETSRGSTGILKGKAAYMAPEYVDGREIDRRVDVFGLGVVLWEALARRRLFEGRNQADTLWKVVNARVPALCSVVPELGNEMSRVVAKALERAPGRRFQDAQQLGTALEEAADAAGLLAPHAEVGAFARAVVGEELEERRQVVETVIHASDEQRREIPTRAERRPEPEVSANVGEASTFSGSGTEAKPPARRERRLWMTVGGLAMVAGILAVAVQQTSLPEPSAAPSGSRPAAFPVGGPSAAGSPGLTSATASAPAFGTRDSAPDVAATTAATSSVASKPPPRKPAADRVVSTSTSPPSKAPPSPAAPPGTAPATASATAPDKAPPNPYEDVQ